MINSKFKHALKKLAKEYAKQAITGSNKLSSTLDEYRPIMPILPKQQNKIKQSQSIELPRKKDKQSNNKIKNKNNTI